MNELLVQTHLSAQQTFAVACPRCHHLEIFKLSDLPADFPNPYKYDCPCGAPLKVVLNHRKSYRKDVKLVGCFTVSSEARKIQRFFDVLDISTTGMQIATEEAKTIQKGQLLDATVVLHDKQRTKSDLACIVRRISPDQHRLILGLEFTSLNPYQQQVLGSYLMF